MESFGLFFLQLVGFIRPHFPLFRIASRGEAKLKKEWKAKSKVGFLQLFTAMEGKSSPAPVAAKGEVEKEEESKDLSVISLLTPPPLHLLVPSHPLLRTHQGATNWPYIAGRLWKFTMRASGDGVGFTLHITSSLLVFFFPRQCLAAANSACKKKRKWRRGPELYSFCGTLWISRREH